MLASKTISKGTRLVTRHLSQRTISTTSTFTSNTTKNLYPQYKSTSFLKSNNTLFKQSTSSKSYQSTPLTNQHRLYSNPITKQQQQFQSSQQPQTLLQLSQIFSIRQEPIQSSLLVSVIVGAISGVLTYYGWTTTNIEQKKVITFADIERILAEPDPISFTDDFIDDDQRKYQQRDLNIDDYRLIINLTEDEMPLIEKIDSLRQLLLKHLQQTFPLYNLMEDGLEYLNAALMDRLYLQYVLQAKLLHRTLDLPIDPNDVRSRVQHDSLYQVMNVEQLSQLRAVLIMLNDKIQYDFPSREQAEYLNENELRKVYNDLSKMCLENALKLAYYKFLVVYNELEHTVQDKELFQRLDTTVTSTHNAHGNAYTDAVDNLHHLGLKQRISMYRTKTMDITAAILSDLEFFIDAIPQVNDIIRTNIKHDIYRLARQQLQDSNDELDTARLDKLVEEAYAKSSISYDTVSVLHQAFHQSWLQLAFMDERRINLLHDDDLPELYRSARASYLDARSKEFIPKFLLQQYNLEKPLKYSELLNRAYLLLPSHELEKPVADGFMQFYLEQDVMTNPPQIQNETNTQSTPTNTTNATNTPTEPTTNDSNVPIATHEVDVPVVANTDSV